MGLVGICMIFVGSILLTKVYHKHRIKLINENKCSILSGGFYG